MHSNLVNSSSSSSSDSSLSSSSDNVPTFLASYSSVFSSEAQIKGMLKEFKDEWKQYESRKSMLNWLLLLKMAVSKLTKIMCCKDEPSLSLKQNAFLKNLCEAVSHEVARRKNDATSNFSEQDRKTYYSRVEDSIGCCIKYYDNMQALILGSQSTHANMMQATGRREGEESLSDNPFYCALIGGGISAAFAAIYTTLTGGWALIPIATTAAISGGTGFAVTYTTDYLIDHAFSNGTRWNSFLQEHPFQAGIGVAITGFMVGYGISVAAGEMTANQAASAMIKRVVELAKSLSNNKIIQKLNPQDIENALKLIASKKIFVSSATALAPLIIQNISTITSRLNILDCMRRTGKRLLDEDFEETTLSSSSSASMSTSSFSSASFSSSFSTSANLAFASNIKLSSAYSSSSSQLQNQKEQTNTTDKSSSVSSLGLFSEPMPIRHRSNNNVNSDSVSDETVSLLQVSSEKTSKKKSWCPRCVML